jgi:hypothetical protein
MWSSGLGRRVRAMRRLLRGREDVRSCWRFHVLAYARHFETTDYGRLQRTQIGINARLQFYCDIGAYEGKAVPLTGDILLSTRNTQEACKVSKSPTDYAS